jgi:small neutral amino acid transporter SnatA (MarC family)
MNIFQRNLYNLEIQSTKKLPIILAILSILSTILSYFGIDTRIFSIIGGLSILTILRMYLSSFTYKLCTHHRMFIYYLMLSFVIDIIDYYT